jgi:hypothetical protein
LPLRARSNSSVRPSFLEKATIPLDLSAPRFV